MQFLKNVMRIVAEINGNMSDFLRDIYPVCFKNSQCDIQPPLQPYVHIN